MRFIYTKSFALFTGCLVLVSFMVFLQAKGWLGPLQTAITQAPRPIIVLASAAARPVRTFFATIYRLKRIAAENSELNVKLMQSQINQVELDQLRKENEALRAELGFARQVKLSLIPCSIIAQNAFGFTDNLIINCGLAQGAQEGQAIISGGYLAGKIIYAGQNSSNVILSTASKFSTDARITQTNATGIVRGSFNTGLMLDQLSQNNPAEKGWMVVTGGISEKIPKNIPIGEIGEAVSSSNDLFKKTTLISPVDFNNLEFVFVVQK